jgi:hypothetical protein
MGQPSLLVLPLFGLNSKKIHILHPSIMQSILMWGPHADPICIPDFPVIKGNKRRRKRICTMLPHVQTEIAQPKFKK